MGPLVTERPPGQGRRRTSTQAWRPGASSSSTAATLVVDGDPGGFWLGPTLFDQVTPR